MKNLKKILFFAAYCVIAGTALTSCLDSDGGNYLTTREMTSAEKSRYIAEISGMYSGMVVHTYLRNERAYADTVRNVDWIISRDSTLEISDLPDAIFWRYMKSGDAITEATKNSTSKSELKFDFSGMFIQEYTDGSSSSKLFTLDAKNKEHQFDVVCKEDGVDVLHPVTVKFSNIGRYGNSVGAFDASKKSIFIQLILSGVKVDKTENIADDAVWLVGNKMY